MGTNKWGTTSYQRDFSYIPLFLFRGMQSSALAPAAKLLGSAALTKHGHRSCQTEDKHAQREPQGERG